MGRPTGRAAKCRSGATSRTVQFRRPALMQLAGELPAAVIARKLGIHIEVAVQWQRLSGADWSACAAA